jgi:sugar (pentulose or hexulose) kinase|uniref:FGGY-family carbohydrate kinase n=1 Tax=Candidatus Planktophila sp. TaxID=2175601 RepID=UPI004049DDBE
MQEILIGVDIGTTRIKAVATDLNLKVLTDHAEPTPWIHIKNFSEIDMVLLAQTVITVASKAADLAGGKVIALGFTGFSETGVLIDSAGRPLAPGLAWHDPRGITEPILKELGDFEFRARAGAQLNEIVTISKVLWSNENYPESKKAKHFLSAPEWVAYCLGAEPVNELSLVSRTGFFDVEARKPWEEAIALVGGGKDFLARLVVAGEAIGVVSDEAPENLRGAIITIAGHDHFTAAYYCGAINEGSLFDSMGTAEALLRTFKAPLKREAIAELAEANVGLSCSVIADHYTLLGALPTGLTLERACALVGMTSRDQKIALGNAALAIDPTASAMRVVNNYHGLSVTNLDDAVSPAALFRATVEHLVDDSAEMIALIEKFTGRADNVVIAGGWIKNPVIAFAKERQFGSYRVSDAQEAGATGAAEFAGIAAGKFNLKMK